MAVTKVTTSQRARAITGGPERVIDRAPDGTLWLKIDTGAEAQFWYSKDQGNRWSFAGTPSSVPFPLSAFFPQAFHIDAEGFGHCLARKDNTTLRYARGTPNAAGTAWTWKLLDFAPSNEALTNNSGLDLVAFRAGTGWKAFALSGTTARDGAGFRNTLRLTRIDIGATGAITAGPTETVATSTGVSFPYGCVSFQHTGGGKIATATPHLYVVASVNTPDTTAARQDPLRLIKFTYEAGAWTQGAGLVLDAAVDTTGRTMRAAYDGARLVTAYGTRDRSVGVASAAIRVVEWDEATGIITARAPASPAAGYPLGVSMAVDPASDDFYLVAYGETNDDPQWARYNRAANAWAAWATVAAASMGGVAGRVALAQYVSSSAIDLAYETGADSPYTIFYTKLASTNVAPATPRLISPAPSSVADLATAGAVFRWQFIDPDPGDTQGAWQLRRKVTTAPAYEYYSAASDSWGAAAVWNTGQDDRWSFGPGRWPNGATYQWSVNTRDAAGLASGFAPDALVTATGAPVPVVTAPLATYAGDSSPVVAWDYAGASPQRTWQARIFDLAGYSPPAFDPATSVPVWDSGESAGVQARSVRVDAALVNGGTYRAYLRVSDSGGTYSGWVYGEFTLLLTPPSAPYLEALVEDSYASGLRRVRLVLQGTANLLSVSQAFSHVDAVDWENDANAAVGSSTSGAVLGDRAMAMTALAAGDVAVRSGPGVVPVGIDPPPVPRDFPVAAGQLCTALASFTATATPRLCRLRLRFYRPDDSLVASVVGDAVAALTTVPTQVSVRALPPLGADRVRLVLEVLGCNAGEGAYVDAIDLHPGVSTAYSPGGLAPGQTFTVTRHVGGADDVVRTAERVPPGPTQRLIAYDREMPFGVPVTYTAQAISFLSGSDSPLASDPSASALVVVDSEVWGLRDPLDVETEARALVTDHKTTTREQIQTYRPAGRSLPLVESEGVGGEDGTIRVHIDSLAERRNLRGLLRRPSTMLLQAPSGDQWYVRFLDRGMAHGGGVSQEIDASYVEVARP